MATCHAEEVDLVYLNINPVYKIYFGRRRGLSEKLYFLPCSDKVLVISVGQTAVFGRGRAAEKSMLQKARLKAQNELESFIAAKVSVEEKVAVKNGTTTYFSSFSKNISRKTSVWQVIGAGFSADRKIFCCIIGRIFPKKEIPPSLFN